MKKNSTVTLILIGLFSVLLSGCKKDDSNPIPGFSAKINGAAWTSTITVAGHSTFNNLTSITATNTAMNENFSIILKGSGTGTYNLNEDNTVSVVVGTYDFTSLFMDPPVGSVVISKWDVTNNLVSGSFTFDGADIDDVVYHVTEGKFDNITLQIVK